MYNFRKKIITPEDEKKIVEAYQSGLPASKIIKDVLNNKVKTTKTVYDILKKYSISAASPERYVKLDHGYFSIIEREDQAYILGLMITDGWVNTDRNSLGISLTEEDGYIIETVKRYWKSENKIVTKKGGTFVNIQGLFCNKKPMKQFTVHSRQMKLDLAKYGVVEQKTKKTILPLIKKDLMRHMIRGILDGDGTFYQHSNKINYCIRFLGTPFLAAQIAMYLALELDITYVFPARKNNSDFLSSCEWTKNDEVDKVLEYLYKDCSEDLFLRRKYEKVKSITGKEFR